MLKTSKSALRKFFKTTNLMTDILATLAAAAITVIVIWQIVGRLIGNSAPWTEELTRFSFIWLIFLGIGIGFRKVESARVLLFLKYAPEFIKKKYVWIYTISTIGFFLFMLVYGIELMIQQITMNETSSTLLLPMWLIGLSIPTAAVIGISNVIQSLLYERKLI